MNESDIVVPQTVESLTSILAAANPALKAVIELALEAGPGSEAWETAERAISEGV